MNTRAAEITDEFDRILTGGKAVIEYFPVIKIKGVENKQGIRRVIENLDSYDGIFFTSSNGVKYFFEELQNNNKKYIGEIYSVGEKTSAKVRDYGYRNSFVPENYSAEDLVKEIDKDNLRNKKFLFPRGNLSIGKLVKGILQFTQIDEVIVYENLCTEPDNREIESLKNKLNQKQIDCIAFFSPSAIENFDKITGFPNSDNIDIAVIGNTTLKKAKEKGLKPEITAKKPTSEFLALAIADYYEHK